MSFGTFGRHQKQNYSQVRIGYGIQDMMGTGHHEEVPFEFYLQFYLVLGEESG